MLHDLKKDKWRPHTNKFDDFQKLIKEARLTIALNADLEVDGAVPFFFSNVVPGTTIQVVRYKMTRIKRTLRISKVEVAFIRKVKDSLRAGHKVAIGCQAKNRALI